MPRLTRFSIKPALLYLAAALRMHIAPALCYVCVLR